MNSIKYEYEYELTIQTFRHQLYEVFRGIDKNVLICSAMVWIALTCDFACDLTVCNHAFDKPHVKQRNSKGKQGLQKLSYGNSHGFHGSHGIPMGIRIEMGNDRMVMGRNGNVALLENSHLIGYVK